jgi:hypothetical protein
MFNKAPKTNEQSTTLRKWAVAGAMSSLALLGGLKFANAEGGVPCDPVVYECGETNPGEPEPTMPPKAETTTTVPEVTTTVPEVTTTVPEVTTTVPETTTTVPEVPPTTPNTPPTTTPFEEQVPPVHVG